MPLQRRLLGVGQDRPQDGFDLNSDSRQADGLVLCIPAVGFEPRDFTKNFALTHDAALITGIARNHGLVFENTDSSTMVVVEGSADGLCDFGLADPFTLSAWVDMVPAGGTGTGSIITKAGSTSGNRQYTLYTTGDELNCIIHGTNSEFGDVVDTFGPTHAILTKSGKEEAGDVLVYINGLLIGSGTAGTNTTNNADVQVGARRGTESNTGEGWTLDVGERVWDARIYNRALTPAEAYALWHPDTRWELYRQPGIRVPGFVAAAGVNPKGPLGMPLHGPLGGPIG